MVVATTWLEHVRAQCDMQVAPARLVDSTTWAVDDGRICHRSGGFFSVIGVGVGPDPERGLASTVQPIIDQPEIGLLGFVTHQGGDALEILVQAKPEPGNVGLTQLAPTVQATRSNFLRLHGGKPTVLLDAFHHPATDVLRVRQSEQGTRFLGKYNENALTALRSRIEEPGDEFGWLATDTVLAALLEDFAVNTDARSVLVTAGPTALVRNRVPFARGDTGAFGRLLAASYGAGRRAPQSVDDAERRMSRARQQFSFTAGTVAVQDCAPWVLDQCGLTDPEGALSVIHVAVTTSQREVAAWDQPLITASQQGETTLVAQWHEDRLRFLFALTPEIGLREFVQAHPTVQQTPGPALRFAGLERRDQTLVEVAADAERQVSVHQSDEGGRFHRCVSRYSVALLPETTVAPDLDATVWLTLEQIETLARRSGFFTNEARSVLSLVLGLA